MIFGPGDRPRLYQHDGVGSSHTHTHGYKHFSRTFSNTVPESTKQKVCILLLNFKRYLTLVGNSVEYFLTVYRATQVISCSNIQGYLLTAAETMNE